jgi:hypothetical protein
MDENGKDVAELTGFGICHCNMITSRSTEIISEIFGAIRSFKLRLQLCREQTGKINPSHFSSCDLFYTDGPVSVPFPSVRGL